MASYEVKGTAIVSIVEFVTTRFGADGLARWKAALSPPAQALVDPRLSATSWFPGPPVMEMRQAIIDLFLGGDRTKIKALGYFSGERGLTGVYKLAVKLGSPMWAIDRLGMVFSSYFRPGQVVLAKKEAGFVTGTLQGFPDTNGILVEVFAGFVQKALELSGVKEPKVVVVKAAGDSGFEMQARWS